MASMREHISNYIEKLKSALDNISAEEIVDFTKILKNALDNEKMIFIMGNGGSAAFASHFACDFNKGVSWNKEKKFRIICLNDNREIMMAYANDISYEEIFVGQLKNFLSKGDVVIGVSGSGNSKNVLKAIEYANAFGAVTVGITGYLGGQLKNLAQHSVNTNIEDMQISEDVHLAICHLIMQYFNN